jgi:hypothetical protein
MPSFTSAITEARLLLRREPAPVMFHFRNRCRLYGFSGDQFLLWWNRDAADGGGIESLVSFLNPPYTRPAGANVKVVGSAADLTGDLSAYDTLDFESQVAVGSTGDVALVVPANIVNLFFGPSAWVKENSGFLRRRFRRG